MQMMYVKFIALQEIILHINYIKGFDHEILKTRMLSRNSCRMKACFCFLLNAFNNLNCTLKTYTDIDSRVLFKGPNFFRSK